MKKIIFSAQKAKDLVADAWEVWLARCERQIEEKAIEGDTSCHLYVPTFCSVQVVDALKATGFAVRHCYDTWAEATELTIDWSA
jgi:hypothetical protein